MSFFQSPTQSKVDRKGGKAQKNYTLQVLLEQVTKSLNELADLGIRISNATGTIDESMSSNVSRIRFILPMICSTIFAGLFGIGGVRFAIWSTTLCTFVVIGSL